MFEIRKAVITGGSSGIGMEVVNLLLQDGCEVFSLSRTVHPRENFNSQGTLHQIACDITDESSLDDASRGLVSLPTHLMCFSQMRALGYRFVSDTPKEQIVRMFDVHVLPRWKLFVKAYHS